jgi:hypothetical protein
MTMIFDRDGHEIDDIPLSDKQREVLDLDEEIVVIYHTPQLLRYMLGEHTGTFSLRLQDGHVTAADAAALRAYATLQKRIKVAWERR